MNTELDMHFARMWQVYQTINPDAKRIYDLFAANNSRVINDHIALRTFDLEPLTIENLASLFEKSGYAVKGEYEFNAKNLTAKHYEHESTNRPKIFISALKLNKLSPKLKTLFRI